MKLYVGNLDLQAKSHDIDLLFQAYGSVASANVAMNHATGEGHGYAYVEMNSEREAKSALEHLDGTQFMSRPLTILPAR